MIRAAVACGGTGGHLFPGLATARVMRGRGHSVALWISGRDVEGEVLKVWDGEVVSVKASGMTGGLSLRTLAAVPRLFASCIRSYAVMRRQRPGVLLAMGSYASVGPVVAARCLGVPVILHEANAIPGRAISFLSPLAEAVALTFPSAAGHLKGRRHVVTGLPLRAELAARERVPRKPDDPFTVLVMGGSLGAHRLNEIATEAMCRLHRSGAPLRVVHLAGRADEAAARAQYESAGVTATVYGFLSTMSLAYDAADFVVARAGAASCMEIALCGLPALFVPLPWALRDHQTANARSLEAAGAAEVAAQDELTSERLASYLDACRRDPEKLERMGRQSRAFAIPNAAERLADLLESASREK